MKKNIWTLLQVTWLVLAMFTTHNSIGALGGGAWYCSGLNCVSDNDCESPCRCDGLNSICYSTVNKN